MPKFLRYEIAFTTVFLAQSDGHWLCFTTTLRQPLRQALRQPFSNKLFGLSKPTLELTLTISTNELLVT